MSQQTSGAKLWLDPIIIFQIKALDYFFKDLDNELRNSLWNEFLVQVDLEELKLKQLKRLHSEIPPTAPWLHIPVIHIRSQVKTRQSQSYKFSKNAKNSNFEILQQTLQVTHILKLLDKMYKYEMDPTRTVGATEQTRDAGCPDGWPAGRSETNIPHKNFVVWGK